MYQNPYSDSEMTYSTSTHRYTLTLDYVRNHGIDLSLILDTENHPDPSAAPQQVLDRVSMLVYSNIYNHGRQLATKQYIMACNSDLRDVIRDAMMERLEYLANSGDLSSRSGAIVSQGTRVDVEDLIPSVIEEMILRSAGLLHRGEYQIVVDETLVY